MNFNFTIAAAAGAVALGAGIGYSVYLKSLTRRTADILGGVRNLQSQAVLRARYTNIDTGIPGPPEPMPQDSDYVPLGHIQVAYIVERRNDGDFVHHLISRYPRGSAGELSEVMLLIMRNFVQQFDAAKLEEEVMMHVTTHPSGTQHIDFMVDEHQQKQILSANGLG